jgi:hypothetical protein
MIADISLTESNSTSAVFTVNSGISEGGSNPFAWFGPTDYWYYGQLSGKCDPYSGQEGTDAAEQIQGKVNMRKSLPIGHRYFIDIKNVFCDPLIDKIKYEGTIVCESSLINPDDPNPWDNINDMLLFHNYGYEIGINNFHDCIPPNEMNFYLAGLEEIVYDISYNCFSQQLIGKIFAGCDVQSYIYYGYPDYIIFHSVNIQYGISVGSGIPSEEL